MIMTCVTVHGLALITHVLHIGYRVGQYNHLPSVSVRGLVTTLGIVYALFVPSRSGNLDVRPVLPQRSEHCRRWMHQSTI